MGAQSQCTDARQLAVVYEGQTQYWGNVLAARSGMRPLSASIDALALVAATYAENRPGLNWRNIQDTTNDPIIGSRGRRAYRNYQRSEDYYSGGQMIWLEAVSYTHLDVYKRQVPHWA